MKGARAIIRYLSQLAIIVTVATILQIIAAFLLIDKMSEHSELTLPFFFVIISTLLFLFVIYVLWRGISAIIE